ncbi:hypothetical protein [Nostoc sphaeroides]|uniref:Lipoprotein n=1 Tax=Nostoc sphaeroides CCNUC1 TaxID=2653204 RepID=A0A5P8WH56_9NOSO|nr:hypothetical protein [Nostoc sphaeroides]QFS49530.1 hypothetical protein GXM_07024 [Nostoc sphaeroides CCNUC1]QFS51159.1 hypothetical protein GXM_08653 [Nostoc sphaeroides CCNUC1]
MLFKTSQIAISLALLFSGGIISCQSKTPEQIARVTELELIAAKQKAEATEIKEFVDSTPDLYKVNWKVCSDGFLDQDNNGCKESRDVRSIGFSEAVLVWGPVQEVKFVTKRHFSPNMQNVGLFVKSKGCLLLGKPEGGEQFYKIHEFSLKKGSTLPNPDSTKIDKLSPEDKVQAIRVAIDNAETEIASLNNFGVSSTGFMPTAAKQPCLTLEKWKKQ